MQNIILSAPVKSLSGYGSHSRDILLSLFNSRLFNIQLLTTGWGITSNPHVFTPEFVDIVDFCEGNFIRENAEGLTYVHVGLPSEFRRICPVNIGITAGLECDSISSSWVEGCNLMDCVVVPSNFVRDVFVKCGVTSTVHVVGEGVCTDIFFPKPQTSFNFDIDTKFNFLCVGQWGTPGMDRKNLDQLLQIFVNLHNQNPDIGLILKTFSNNTSTPDAWFTTQRLEMFLPHGIHLLHGSLSDLEMADLYNSSQIQSLISFTSGEGWGRPIAEAIACNLPVIVPNWSGHMDFVSSDVSMLLDTTLIPVPSVYHRTGWFTDNSKWSSLSSDPTSQILSFIENYAEYKKKAEIYGEVFRARWNYAHIYNDLIRIVSNYASTSPQNPSISEQVV